jgi:hypothetical protein
MNFKQLPRSVFLISSLFVLISCGFYFYFISQGRSFDWYYFDSLAAVIKSSILNYHSFPMHDPWVCSGTSIIENPQNWIFSPTLLFTIFFTPTIGNLLSVLMFKLIGFWGTYKYLTQKNLEKDIALLSSALFVNATWFALHFSEGHIPFRTFFLLPLAFLYIENLVNRDNFLKLIGLFVLMILDGGIYPCIFSLVYFCTYYLANIAHLKNLFVFIKNNTTFLILCLLGSLLLVAPKIYPVLVNAATMKAVQETHSIDLKLFISTFFNPFLNNTFLIYDRIRFHEFGSYLGISIAILFILKVSAIRSWKKNELTLFLIVLFFFWIAVGWSGKFNPYSVISSIPIINKTHIQSRYLIVFHLLLILFVSTNTSKYSKKIILTLLIVANIEALVGNYYAFPGFKNNYTLPLITRTDWSKTTNYVPKPQIYYSEGIVSKFCYEPSNLRHNSYSSEEKNYLGEIIKLRGNIKIGSPHLVPGEILLPYSSIQGGSLVLNTNYLDGWIETEVGAEPYNFKGLLGVNVPPGEGTLRLQYFPDYYNNTIIGCLLGLIIMLYLIRKKNEL